MYSETTGLMHVASLFLLILSCCTSPSKPSRNAIVHATMALRRSCAFLAARRSIGRHYLNRAPIVCTKISQPLRVRCRTAVAACKRCRCCAGLSARHFSSSSRADAVGASSVHVGQNGEQIPAAQSESKRAGVGYHMRKGGDGRTRLYWGPDGSTATHRPRRALLVCKPKDIVAACVVRDMAEFLMNKVGVEVVVEPTVREQFGHLASYTSDDIPSLSERVDLLITVGGDGTILWVHPCTALCWWSARANLCWLPHQVRLHTICKGSPSTTSVQPRHCRLFDAVRPDRIPADAAGCSARWHPCPCTQEAGRGGAHHDRRNLSCVHCCGGYLLPMSPSHPC